MVLFSDVHTASLLPLRFPILHPSLRKLRSSASSSDETPSPQGTSHFLSTETQEPQMLGIALGELSLAPEKLKAWCLDLISKFHVALRHLAAKCNPSTGEVKGAVPCVCFNVSLDKGSVAIEEQ